MASYPPKPKGLFTIDEQNRDQYSYLEDADPVFYIWEYPTKLWETCGGKVPYCEYPVYDFINNFQKTGTDWQLKAIKHATKVLGELLPSDWKTDCTFVPTPPSRIKIDPEYDNRIVSMLKGIPELDIKELVLLKSNSERKGKGVPPDVRAENFLLDLELAKNCDREHIFIVDDVLTTGSHYKATEIILRQYFENHHIYGLYLSRSVRPNPLVPDL